MPMPRNSRKLVPSRSPASASTDRSPRRITKRMVDSLEPDGADYVAWDDQLTGFGVRVRASGRRVFVLKYREPNEAQTRRMTLGSFPAITPDEARRLATVALGRLARGERLQDADAKARSQRTLADEFPNYLAERVGKLKPRTIA